MAGFFERHLGPLLRGFRGRGRVYIVWLMASLTHACSQWWRWGEHKLPLFGRPNYYSLSDYQSKWWCLIKWLVPGCHWTVPSQTFHSDCLLSPTLIARFLAPVAAGVEDIVAIMIPEPKGKEIVSLLERNITVTMHITIGTRNLQKYVSRTSVVFVSISFIVLMIISLAWLVFYYIQRFRYANARDRNQVSSSLRKASLCKLNANDTYYGINFVTHK